MNIAFFLLPKQEVVTTNVNATLRQTLERMEYHRYTAVPVLSDDGKYMGTVTEGDLLWFLKNSKDITFENAHRHQLSEVPLRIKNRPVHIFSNMEDLIDLAKTQNFVPIVDDADKFIGIVRRSDIIEYCSKQMFQSSGISGK
ncbi:CBS domain-containing protein [Paenibacillus larvae]|jgi:CBS domain-containing protein|uniref:CBS domain-containing protein n=5 Tax=Paenibacillus larvae TaxID=1464 RepID=V9W569_9BACL|nr:CBS domain-containing protein [Paenibacillus larvae]AHD06186.1 CBS domain-containing protein [Paenibacillus larvae subsp. larvae DSM 25430]AQR77274.1 CBS domain-containing protein [Paenibacillus larvae subsp. larvae]AQT83807.1 CBS domain-containing protein [Paenibacillus larvae subsp. pulvifaciens]AQZ45243.1 CBS domain-containing protein [Paenibacillus larvae subsp. pulvifaciens]ARF69750.1 CBS domain-containing protein [Paenibacillus larvae subsp. pulvifaciens]